MPRKKSDSQVRKSRIRSLKKAVAVVEKSLADPAIDPRRISSLGKSLSSLIGRLSRLEKEKEQSDAPKRNVGRPKLSVRLIGPRRRLDGRQYALWQTANGQDILIDLPVDGDKLISREQAEILTRAKAEQLAADAHTNTEKPKPSREESLRVCALLGCSDAHPCVLCKPYRSDPNAGPAVPAESAEQSTAVRPANTCSIDDVKPDAGSTSTAESHEDEPADSARPVQAQSEPDPVPAPDVHDSPSVEQVGPGSASLIPDIAKLKAEVQQLRDRLLLIYDRYCQTNNPKIAEDFAGLQSVLIPAVEHLKAVSPDGYRELISGYEAVLLSPSDSPSAKPIVSEATQIIMEARWQSSLTRKPKPVKTDFTWEP